MRAACVPTTPPPITTMRAGCTPGTPPMQQAAAAVVSLERRPGRFDRKPAGDLAHRSEQGKTAVRVGDRLVSDRRTAGFHQTLRLLRIRRQMQIGEQNLAFPQLRPLGRLRLLDLDDHVGRGEDLRGSVNDGGAGLAIDIVARANSVAGFRSPPERGGRH